MKETKTIRKGGVKIVIKNLQKKILIDPKKIKLAILKTLSLKRIKKSGEITLSFVDNKQIRELNLMYLGKDEPTDVLSFDLSRKNSEILADIAVSTDMAMRNARTFKTTYLYEVYLYVIHGTLHILGYNDKTIKQRKIMDKRAKCILKTVIRKP